MDRIVKLYFDISFEFLNLIKKISILDFILFIYLLCTYYMLSLVTNLM